MENNKKSIVVIGYGYVGKAIVDMFKDHYRVVVYDTRKIEEHEYPHDIKTKDIIFVEDLEHVHKADLAVICVPTPMKEDYPDEFKPCDVSLVEDIVKKLETPVILIKSTIEPGTTDRLKKETGKRIVFSPEYSGENKYWSSHKFHKDIKECPFVILGGEPEDRRHVLDLIVPILGPQKTYFQVSAKEAEVIKYMENTYFGVKVIFANEMKNICDALGVDYYAVRTGWALDPRVDSMHTMVFPDSKGFGGKCLPKDINAIIKASQKAGYEPLFLKEIINSNKRFRKEE
jgi:nucleotide sugar dehydrogenase